MSAAAHVGVLSVCRNCLSRLARTKFFFNNNKSTTCAILAAAVSVPHIFRSDNVCPINSLLVMRAGTLALSDIDGNLNLSRHLI